MIKEQEEVYAIYVNADLNLIDHSLLFRGGAKSCFDYKILFKHAFANNAYGVFIAHNHPSGALKPSQGDRDTTKKIVSLSTELGVKLLDHISFQTILIRALTSRLMSFWFIRVEFKKSNRGLQHPCSLPISTTIERSFNYFFFSLHHFIITYIVNFK